MRVIPRRAFSLGLLGLGVLGCKSAGSRSQPTNAAPQPSNVTANRPITRPVAPAHSGAPPETAPPAPNSAPNSAPTDARTAIVYLLPLGHDFKNEDLTFIADTVQLFYRVTCKLLPAMPLPQAAYYPPRGRYRAEKLLDALYEQRPQDAHVIIGLTTVDISTTKGPHEDWGILGLATVAGTECVISKFRAQKSAVDVNHVQQRLGKTVVHEVGHTLGLRHCPNFGCLMEDGQGTVLTTDHEYDLCSACRTALGAWARDLPSDGPPWPKPAPG